MMSYLASIDFALYHRQRLLVALAGVRLKARLVAPRVIRTDLIGADELGAIGKVQFVVSFTFERLRQLEGPADSLVRISPAMLGIVLCETPCDMMLSWSCVGLSPM